MPRTLLLMLAFFSFACFPSLAVDLRQRETLKGIRGVVVMVRVAGFDQSLDTDLQRSLQVDTELRLRQNKIVVLDSGAAVASQPVLTVRLGLYRSDQSNVDAVAFCLDANVAQDAALARNSKVVKAVTYQSLTLIGLTNTNVLREHMKKSVSEIVDSFINDFLAENRLP
jgi:hypothetical protein